MNRRDFQQLAHERIKDADALIQSGCLSGAYYLAGYAVECALKACIAKMTNQFDYPDKQFAGRCFTHNLDTLMEIAQLDTLWQAEAKRNSAFALNWQLVKNWPESARYEMWQSSEAVALFTAVSDNKNGVLQWIMGHW